MLLANACGSGRRWSDGPTAHGGSPTPTAGGLLVEPHPVASSAGCGEPYRLPMAAKKACTSSRVAWGKLSVSGSCRRAAIASQPVTRSRR